jgi:hypothetical protein
MVGGLLFAIGVFFTLFLPELSLDYLVFFAGWAAARGL